MKAEERALLIDELIEAGGDPMEVIPPIILAVQREAEERMRERCAGLAGGHVMNMNGLQIQAAIEALPSEYP